MYCEENSLTINLSFDMPEGYETANGTFDMTVNTLFINKEMLQSQPEYEQMFYLWLSWIQGRKMLEFTALSGHQRILCDVIGNCP